MKTAPIECSSASKIFKLINYTNKLVAQVAVCVCVHLCMGDHVDGCCGWNLVHFVKLTEKSRANRRFKISLQSE